MGAAPPRSPDPNPSATDRLWRAGRGAWAILGILGVVVVAGYVVSLVPLLVVPLVLALFPATLLVPVASALKRRKVPPALASLVSILAGILLIAAVIGGMVPLVVAQLPDLVDSASEGIADIEGWLEDDPLGVGIEGFGDLLEAAQRALGDIGDFAPQAFAAVVTAFETLIGLILMLVLLFFFLKDGRRLANGLASLAPERYRGRALGVAEESWSTLGSYFRGQLLVALVDAVLIGIGLVVLGVPLALPLAVLIFFGGLFPIVGAVTTGALAVLVAFADAGFVTALIVLGIVLAVQQLESNVLEPVILSRAIDLHPVVVLLSITAGALLLGILGAFLAVPLAAVVKRAVRYLREREQEDRWTAATASEPADEPEPERLPGQ